MKHFTTVAGIVLLCCVHVIAWPWDVETVKELDVQKYIGRWYEAYGSLIQKATFQKDSYCTCADYGIRKDGKVSVFNAGHLHSPTGKANNITGFAYVVDPKFPGKLRVEFPGVPHAVAGNYWVMKLGPLNKDGQYSYSIVSSNLKSFLWILVRDVDDYMKKYDADVQKYVKEQGFTWFWNRPRKTYQEKDCLYPPKS